MRVITFFIVLILLIACNNTQEGSSKLDLRIVETKVPLVLLPDGLPLNDYMAKGNEFLVDGEFENAVNAFSQVLRLDVNNIEAYNNRGVAYKSLGEFQKAIDDYNAAIDINPSYANYYNNR